MIGLVLVTHGNLAAELVAVMEHIVGKQEHVQPISIGPDDDMARRREDILKAIQKIDQGKGVILLTDMFGGTPSNLAISVMEGAKVEVLAGVNLPMLIKLAALRTDPKMTIKKVALEAEAAGRKYIRVASRILRGEKSSK